MLTGQNNGEKDVLRAFYRGLVKHFSQTVTPFNGPEVITTYW